MSVVMPSLYVRFGASGGVCPQKHLCEFANVSPAQTFVKPPPASSLLQVKTKT